MLELKGKLGKTISVDDDFVRINQKSMLMGTIDKKIPIRQISSVEVKKPGLMAGYIQISEIGNNKNRGLNSAAFQAASDENSVLFNSSDDYDYASKIKEFIESQMVKLNRNESSNSSLSAADEILKYKSLLDQGIISPEEFEKKKIQLLSQ